MGVVFGFGLGTLVLLVAIAWGVWQYNRRGRANEPITERATRELYRNPDRYADRGEDELRSKLR